MDIIEKDGRIIDLDKPFEELKLPRFFGKLLHNKSNPVNLNLCTGDGIQDGITDIEWYTTGMIGHEREKKPTTIFMTTKYYDSTAMSSSLLKNIEYLLEHKELKVILLIYNHADVRYKENLVRLFPNAIDNIYEDVACYGDKLDLKTLYGILKDNGTYDMDLYHKALVTFIDNLYLYDDFLKFFTIIIADRFAYIEKNNSDILIFDVDSDVKPGKSTNKGSATGRHDRNDVVAAIKRYETRKELDDVDTQLREQYYEKRRINCEKDKDCKMRGRRGGKCDLEEKLCYFDTDGGKRINNKKTSKARRIKRRTIKRNKPYKR